VIADATGTIPDAKAPLGVDDFTTIRTPHGAEVTLYRNAWSYRVTALDCYTRRIYTPMEFVDEQKARDLARTWTINVLKDEGTFRVETRRNGRVISYTVTL
jgi:hypothetical protein